MIPANPGDERSAGAARENGRPGAQALEEIIYDVDVSFPAHRDDLATRRVDWQRDARRR